MKKITIKPVWTIQGADNVALSPRLIELLSAVHQEGSLLAACQRLGLSYRHVWGQLKAWETELGQELLAFQRGCLCCGDTGGAQGRSQAEPQRRTAPCAHAWPIGGVDH